MVQPGICNIQPYQFSLKGPSSLLFSKICLCLLVRTTQFNKISWLPATFVTYVRRRTPNCQTRQNPLLNVLAHTYYIVCMLAWPQLKYWYLQSKWLKGFGNKTVTRSCPRAASLQTFSRRSYSLIQKNRYTFATVYSSNYLSIFFIRR